MDQGLRACVAYIVGVALGESQWSGVYDNSAGKHVSISGEVTEQSVSIYDYERQCHVGGSLSAFYDFGLGEHVTLQITENQFTGYDYGSGSHYSGSVNAGAVSIFDHAEGKYFLYSV